MSEIGNLTLRGIAYEEDRLNKEDAWLLFASFAGDVERTAVAVNVSPSTILKVADDEGWLTRLAPIIALRKSSKPGDLERALNRSLNYVQAHKFRMVVERVIHRLTGMDADEMEEYMFSKIGCEGIRERSLTTRALADLASAMEKAQSMTYQALSDTSSDRAKRKDDPGAEGSAGEMHTLIAAAMGKVRGSKTPRAMLFDAQLAVAAEIAPKVVRPPADDTHVPE